MICSEKARENLKSLGERLRDERLYRNETQKVFAARIGASTPTLIKMESGDPKVQLGFWVAAMDVLGHEDDLNQLIAPSEDLFVKYEQTQKGRRKRASRRKKTP
jgi:transcriptional regulator with XRE-family HTH domain